MKTRIAAFATSLVLGLLITGQARAQADLDLSGVWNQKTHEDWQEEGDGPDLGDFLGLPINDEARTRALSYSASSLSLPERQCLFYAPNYLIAGLQGINLTADTDPVTGRVNAWVLGAIVDRGAITVWMDGRKPPPDAAPRPIGGFTTGEWIGNTLKTVTTRMRQGYVRRNGTPSSERAVYTMHFTRHGNTLTVVGTVDDPVYLDAPLVRSRVYVLNTAAVPTRTAGLCTPAAEIASLDGFNGVVPHVDPATSTVSRDFAKTYALPLEAVLGGEATMLPEYRNFLKGKYQRPEACTRFCCGWAGNGNAALPLKCEITATPRSPESVRPLPPLQ
ncbi:MAG: hypothetical protein ABL964_16220 [Steroidobacteraceae bacterium]